MRVLSDKLFVLAFIMSCLWTAIGAVATEPQETPYWTPLQLSLATPVQIVPAAWDVMGLRLNVIYGDNHDVGVLDVGLVNRTTGRQTGMQIGGIMNRVEGSASGIQLAGIVNSVSGNSMVEGAQVACMNTVGDGSGLQIGIVNHARTMQGVQVGLINLTSELSGLQVGLINWNEHGTVQLLPLLNVGF